MVRITHAALNHRDLFIRQHLYPGTTFGVPLLADGCGTVVSTGSPSLNARWKNKRVVLTPGRGWARAVEGPETGAYQILGGTKYCPLGTLQEYIVVDANEVEEVPEHLSGPEAAALPLTGLTAWRAVFTKSGNAMTGHNILVTGIGGGVALNALQFATAADCNVYVTSGSAAKLQRATDMGAAGGVNYKDESWERQLLKQLPKDRKYLDAVIDGAGGDVVEKATKMLKVGDLESREIACKDVLTVSSIAGWGRDCQLRNDAWSQDALAHGGRDEEHRGRFGLSLNLTRLIVFPLGARLDHGLARRVCRHGRFRAREQGPACNLSGCAWHRQPARN